MGQANISRKHRASGGLVKSGGSFDQSMLWSILGGRETVVGGKMNKSQFRHFSSRHGSSPDCCRPLTLGRLGILESACFLSGSYEPGSGLVLETVERQSLPSRKLHPNAGEEEGHATGCSSRSMGPLWNFGQCKEQVQGQKTESSDRARRRGEKGVVEGPAHAGT